METTPPPSAAASAPPSLDARLSTLETRLTSETKARELEMVRQEHRLVPAVGAWLQSVFARPFDAARFTASSQALVWCLVPSPATASISLISILGLLVALQANRLMTLQTDRMEEQNMLAEAQRRASLVIEATSLFEQIEKEKEIVREDAKARTEKPRACSDDNDTYCWHGQLFVPTEATMGRLAALTQALRPYRYLVVDPREAAQDCDDYQTAAWPTTLNDALFQTLLGTASQGLDADLVKATIEREIDSRTALDVPGALTRLKEWLESWLAPARMSARLSCLALSPERGQLLGSLHAARIDLSALAQRGATFELADLPDGSDLNGITLKGVNLSGARLRGAVFTHAALNHVNFEGADLSGASFQTACLAGNNFTGAQIETLGKQQISRLQLVGSVPLHFLPQHLSFDDQLDSLWVRYQRPSDGFDRFCATLNTLESRVSLQSDHPELAEQALVLAEHLRHHWLVEVTGANFIAGAALLRPDALDPGLAAVGLGKPSLLVDHKGTTVRIFALSNCPVLEPREPDAQAEALMATSLVDCRARLGLQ